MTDNPARWARDPSGRHELRYWNGTAWTQHVSDRGVASTDPAGSMPARRSGATRRPATQPSGRSTGRPSRPGRTSRRSRARSTASHATPLRGPTPIVTKAGWSKRTKAVAWFLAIDAMVVTFVLWLVLR